MWIVGMLLYGGGLRLEECLSLRVIERSQVVVRRRKGQKDRTTTLPRAVFEAFRRHLAAVRKPA